MESESSVHTYTSHCRFVKWSFCNPKSHYNKTAGQSESLLNFINQTLLFGKDITNWEIIVKFSIEQKSHRRIFYILKLHRGDGIPGNPKVPNGLH